MLFNGMKREKTYKLLSFISQPQNDIHVKFEKNHYEKKSNMIDLKYDSHLLSVSF